MSDRTLTLLLATGATFACASLVARVRSRAARRLTMSGAAEPAVRWALDDDARTAASADQAHILAQAWGSDPEIGVFGGTLCAEPMVTVAPAVHGDVRVLRFALETGCPVERAEGSGSDTDIHSYYSGTRSATIRTAAANGHTTSCGVGWGCRGGEWVGAGVGGCDYSGGGGDGF